MAKKNEATSVSIIPSDLSSQASAIRGTMNRATAKYRQSLNADGAKKLGYQEEAKQAYDLLVEDVKRLGEMICCV